MIPLFSGKPEHIEGFARIINRPGVTGFAPIIQGFVVEKSALILQGDPIFSGNARILSEYYPGGFVSILQGGTPEFGSSRILQDKPIHAGYEAIFQAFPASGYASIQHELPSTTEMFATLLQGPSEFGEYIEGFARITQRPEYEAFAALLNELPETKEGFARIINEHDIAEWKEGFARIAQSVNIESFAAIFNSLPETKEGFSRIQNTMTAGEIEAFAVLLQGTHSGEQEGFASIIHRFAPASYEIHTDNPGSYQVTGNASLVCPHDVFLDGIEISGMITEFRISYDRAARNSEIEIMGIGKDIFDIADPKKQLKIQIDIGNRSRKFFLESVTGDDEQSRLWGRGLAGLDDVETSPEHNIIIEDYQTARAVSESVLDNNPLIWDIEDFVLPVGFQIDGKPLDVIERIAKIAGAKISPVDGLGVRVENWYQVRPIDSQTVLPTLEYDDTMIFRGDSTVTEAGDKYDSVEIFGAAANVELPRLEVEPLPQDATRYIGTPSYIRVWPKNGSDIGLLEGFVTDGMVEYAGETTIEHTETVEFNRTVGSVNYPVTTLKNINWWGLNPGEIDFEQGETEMSIWEQYAIADITYTTTYHLQLLP